MSYEILYINSLLNKSKTLKENKDKIGVYRWINIITRESYIGSSVNINKRLRTYYSITYLEKKMC
jgi:excinuclease UvrABC nuclease subunit